MNTKRLWVVLLIVFACFSLVNKAEAQEPDEIQETPDTQGTNGLAYDLTWPSLLYGERTLGENNTNTRYDLFLPGDIIPLETGNFVDFVLSHTTLQAEKEADLSVSFNNSFLEIIPLTAENAERGLVRVDIPGDLIRAGRNRLELDMNNNLVCGETAPTRLITVIHEDSQIHVEYDLNNREPDLGIYPLPFYEQTFLPSDVYFVLPAQPTVADISTAASVSAGLGIYSQGQVRIAAVLETELTDEIRENNNFIVIGQPDTVDLLAELDLPLPMDNALIKDDSGVLQELISPWNPRKMILVVTGHTDQGLLKAGDVLNRDLNFLGMRGPIAIVEQVLPPAQTSTERQIDLTFDSLGYEDTTFYGIRPQIQRYDFQMPRSWEMSGEAKLTLSLNHSTVINPELSTVSVELNRVPVGSALLNAENAINGILEIELPTWLLEPGENRLEVEVAMKFDKEEAPCVNVNNRQAWTVIRRDSFIHLPYIEQEAPFDLNLFPFPFAENDNLINVSLVLPSVLNRPERDRLLRLAMVLGQQAGGDRITLRAINAQDIDDTTKTSNHLIVIGRSTINPLLAELNNYLPQPFKAGTDELAPKLDSAVLIETATRDGGMLQELMSPWNPERTILAITGTTDQGVAAAFDLLMGDLPEEIGHVNINGDLAVIEGEQVHSTDTRLLNPQLLSQQPERVRVEPVTQPGVPLQHELADRWW